MSRPVIITQMHAKITGDKARGFRWQLVTGLKEVVVAASARPYKTEQGCIRDIRGLVRAIRGSEPIPVKRWPRPDLKA